MRLASTRRNIPAERKEQEALFEANEPRRQRRRRRQASVAVPTHASRIARMELNPQLTQQNLLDQEKKESLQDQLDQQFLTATRLGREHGVNLDEPRTIEDPEGLFETPVDRILDELTEIVDQSSLQWHTRGTGPQNLRPLISSMDRLAQERSRTERAIAEFVQKPRP
jgi:hypothetical protein